MAIFKGVRGAVARGAVALAGALAVTVTAPRAAWTETAPPGRPPEILYLDFSDGSEAITGSSYDSAADNRSAIGATPAYPAFDWARIADGSGRDAVIQQVAGQVGEAFRPYNILVSTTRPTQRGYSTVMIGGGPSLFHFPPQVAGVALLDCDNREEGNLAFAFSDNLGDTHALWVTIAQEAAHTFGLEHTDDERDIMYPRSTPSQVGFLDEEATVVTPICGPLLQSSQRRLHELLGDWEGSADKPDIVEAAALAAFPPRDDGLADSSGCAVAPGHGRGPAGGPPCGRLIPGLSLAFLFLCPFWRSRLARNARPAYKVRSRG